MTSIKSDIVITDVNTAKCFSQNLRSTEQLLDNVGMSVK